LIELIRDSLENEIPYIKFKNVSFSYPGEKENLIFKLTIYENLLNRYLIKIRTLIIAIKRF